MMEDTNKTPHPEEELFAPMTEPAVEPAGDMPSLDLSGFSGEAAPEAPIPLEPLFPEEPGAPAGEIPEEAEILPEEIPAEILPEELPNPAAEEISAEDMSPEVPAVEEMPLEEPVLEETPQRDFSEFDIPMDEPAPEVPAFVFPVDEPALDTPDPVSNPPEAVPFPLDVFDPESDGFADAFEEQPIQTAFEDGDEFTEMLTENTSEPEEPPAMIRPPRKGRPKRKKGYGLFGIPHLLVTLVWLAIIFAIGVSLGRMLWICAADVLAFGRESREVVVTINKEDTIDEIAQTLQEKGLIRYAKLFKLYAGIAVDEGEIAPGTYTLNTILDYHALVGQMSPSSSSRAVVEDVLIPEGYNCRQIFELLEQNGICTVEELEDYAANGEFQDFWFLEGVERGDKYCLEGFLFPDTYDFYAGSTPREALGKMLLGFESRFTEELHSQLPALNERLSEMMRKNGCSKDFIAEHQLDLRDLLIVASLIEKETANAAESPTIASVIYNRLTQDQVYERYLGIDAAIIYATGDAENIDTSIDHPYNTYKNAGLTPGPIANPGLDSIKAALNFQDTGYYYYVLNPSTGTHQFSKTLAEHEQWVEKFRNMTAEEG